jgi:hypothetical protein
VVDRIALRVATRFAGAAPSKTVGRYEITWLPQHEAKFPLVEHVLEETEKKYQAKGIRFEHKFEIIMSGKGVSGAAEYIPLSTPRIKMAPKSFGPGLYRTMIHEMAHYLHDKIVPDGFENPEVEARYAWAVKQSPKKNDDYLQRFELAAHEWIPTSYARTNPREWFAEMLTSYVMGHLKSEPSDWLVSVLKTGKAP